MCRLACRFWITQGSPSQCTGCLHFRGSKPDYGARQGQFPTPIWLPRARIPSQNRKYGQKLITIFNQLFLVLKHHDVAAQALACHESSGLLHQVRPPCFKSCTYLEETLESTTVPQMLRGQDWVSDKGIDVHLSLTLPNSRSAGLEFTTTKMQTWSWN